MMNIRDSEALIFVATANICSTVFTLASICGKIDPVVRTLGDSPYTTTIKIEILPRYILMLFMYDCFQETYTWTVKQNEYKQEQQILQHNRISLLETVFITSLQI